MFVEEILHPIIFILEFPILDFVLVYGNQGQKLHCYVQVRILMSNFFLKKKNSLSNRWLYILLKYVLDVVFLKIYD